MGDPGLTFGLGDLCRLEWLTSAGALCGDLTFDLGDPGLTFGLTDVLCGDLTFGLGDLGFEWWLLLIGLLLFNLLSCLLCPSFLYLGWRSGDLLADPL